MAFPLATIDWGLPVRLLRLALRSRRIRRRPSGRRKGPPPRMSDVYRAIAHGHRREIRHVLLHVRGRHLSPRGWLDATTASLLVRWMTREAARVRSIVEFAAAYYDPEDRDRGVARARRRLDVLARAGAELPPEAQALRAAASWDEAAGTAIRAVATSRPSEPPPPPAPAARRRGPVVFRLTGGLGNQLFQYAAARRYAERAGVDLAFDLEYYERRSAPRELLLRRLRVEVPRASLLDVARALRHRHDRTPGMLDPALLEARPGLGYVAGYWENPAYFAGREDRMREEVRPRDAAVESRARALAAAARADGRPLVALHVRRGDRVPGPGASPFRALPVQYYRRAVAEFGPEARFLVFSDSPTDVAWCRENLGLEGRDAVYAEGLDPIVDLVAMSSCDHFIVSSSTFSWWAAWLCRNPDKRVVAPDPRVSTGPVQADSFHRFPVLPGWRVVTVDPPDRGAIRRRAPR